MSEHLFDLFRLELLADLAPEYARLLWFYIGITGKYGKFSVSLYSDSFLFKYKKGTLKRCLSKFISRFEASEMPFPLLVFFLVEEIYLY